MAVMSLASAGTGVDSIIKFLSTTAGRDKFNRFIQFFTRFLISFGEKRGFSKELLARLTALMNATSQARKLMFLGRQVEFIRSAQKALSLQDEIVRLAVFSKSIFLSLWLSCDFMLWIHTVGIAKFDTIKDITRRSNRFWLCSLVASLMGTVYKLRNINHRSAQEIKVYKAIVSNKLTDEAVSTVDKTISKLNSERKALFISAIQDSIDLLIPATGLGYITVDSGVIGIAGAITSLIGAYSLYK
ncbi:hypothetical protein BATDEDRAFT_89538 [Batrachochytrium dendrobatidis JAM81]|uniref:Peroxisomal biogenesis factor 11 n=2 Tax=Batrachochytrium dendrobatidis TaxID=109871 RepID=F4P5P8_BATDJ|nr:uncharacterized protein BATDEDRAFT_89538 [Batrachochytrium dendrobatidis JAM81]EGF79222.1 hypothetical protein BATDEDRAFT_89538 [Batrachochytrium dendrobatidis JAM81]OAJ42860.1 hypothetical protein BDEG_26261 [Batrachochytrium dendrobatidis JEL423]|eukprot:XP_006680061.1 hypothetical protein BATDEDRAFT_89538 [Batrachochytrium dendrobatidis JAM81]